MNSTSTPSRRPLIWFLYARHSSAHCTIRAGSSGSSSCTARWTSTALILSPTSGEFRSLPWSARSRFVGRCSRYSYVNLASLPPGSTLVCFLAWSGGRAARSERSVTGAAGALPAMQARALSPRRGSAGVLRACAKETSVASLGMVPPLSAWLVVVRPSRARRARPPMLRPCSTRRRRRKPFKLSKGAPAACSCPVSSNGAAPSPQLAWPTSRARYWYSAVSMRLPIPTACLSGPVAGGHCAPLEAGPIGV